MKKEQSNDDESKVSLVDFVIPELIDAFCGAYTPLNEWEAGCETFTYTKLRNFFKAVVTTQGDPFALYVQLLGDRGFRFKVDTIIGEPVMYVQIQY